MMRWRRGYRIRLLGRELFEYREGAAAYVFVAGWAVDPPVLGVPSPEAWDQVMPAEFHGRREEIIERLRRSWHVRGHVFEDANA
jgi:hypothetical protein